MYNYPGSCIGYAFKFCLVLTNSVEEAGGTVRYGMLDDILVKQQEEMGEHTVLLVFR